MSDFDESAIVTPRKIARARDIGNRDGVRRLARFVSARSASPTEVYEKCQEQRLTAIR